MYKVTIEKIGSSVEIKMHSIADVKALLSFLANDDVLATIRVHAKTGLQSVMWRGAKWAEGMTIPQNPGFHLPYGRNPLADKLTKK